ncbi:related to alpha/beta hydrolase [Ustilago trichophora]|uniref:Related to alpha/beta hydrolase n=1 Tax=Ustilago trichophora TaxID=86804 RepID=A0A5C3EJ02_9BASI|nr:related to alpha/beta hydrolase [Ustilago trichophora]
MATEALLPFGAAYTGATQASLDSAKASAGAEYFPTVFNPATVHSKGRAVVAKGRASLTKGSETKEGFKLYYEVHGNGPVKVVFVMGLNNSCFGWLPQVEHLARDPQYSCLVFDNRGVSNSETPTGWYKTSDMAQDTFDLLEHLGWIKQGAKRSVHVAGVSMGGMIGLEMARQRPELLASLTLISTAPGRRFRTPTYGVTSLARVLGGRTLGFDSEQYRLNRLITTLFPTTWLSQPSSKARSQTNQEALYEMFKWRYAFTTRQNIHGAISQMKAALTHNIPDADLDRINRSVPKICILTGDTDFLVDPRNSDYLKNKLTTAEFHKFKDAGHALGNQIAEKVNQILEKVIAEGVKAVEKGA